MPGKLGKTTKQRMALLRGQASQLLWYGRIETTQARAKELRSYVEKLITKAVNTYDDVVEYEVVAKDKKGKEVKTTSVKDGPKKLAARRQIIAKTYDLQEIKAFGESKKAYKERTAQVQHSTRSLPSTHSARKSSARAAAIRGSISSVSAAATLPKRQSSSSSEFRTAQKHDQSKRPVSPTGLFLRLI